VSGEFSSMSDLTESKGDDVSERVTMYKSLLIHEFSAVRTNTIVFLSEVILG
jgi:hypothetical protein